jgi:hypothetical protein
LQRIILFKHLLEPIPESVGQAQARNTENLAPIYNRLLGLEERESEPENEKSRRKVNAVSGEWFNRVQDIGSRRHDGRGDLAI